MTPYATTTDAGNYFTARGQTAEWSAVSDQGAALVRASQYIDLRYRRRIGTGKWACMFSGERVNGRAQDQEWPRVNAVDYYGNSVDSSSIPDEVKNATIEAALREGTNPGSLLPDYDPSTDRLPTSEQIGSLKISYGNTLTYKNATAQQENDTSPAVPIFPEIDAIIAPLLTGPGASAYGSGVAMNVIR